MQEFYKRNYTTKEFYHLVDDAIKSMKYVKKAKKNKLIDDELEEKIMLAVTEVNGCELCNVYHTQKSEKIGISLNDIEILTSGGFNVGVKKEESILEFAKQYVIQNGDFSQSEFDKIVELYGEEFAQGVLGVIRVIMMGNAYGIATGAFFRRLKLQPVKNSSLINEIGVTLSIVFFAPIAIIKYNVLKIV